MAIARSAFGRVDGVDVDGFDVDGGSGLRMRLLSYGARLAELHVPDRAGRTVDVVLGFDTLDEYLANGSYFGATCGRYGNRIRGGRFTLDGHTVALPCNEGRNHLHGGRSGFDRRVWDANVDEARNEVTFALVSPDGDQGYPGRLAVTASYRLDGATLEIVMRASTDRATVVNLVNHAYWNLGGQGSGDIRKHELALNAGFYTPVDAELLPTGEILSVEGTPFDFRSAKPIGRNFAQVSYGNSTRADGSGRSGYDHNWCLAGEPGRMKLCARAVDPGSGRAMELHTTEPGVQLYTAGHLSAQTVAKAGLRYCPYAGFTLETQKYPDSPNHGHFPSPRVDPGTHAEHRMQFRFFSL
jgi:aldose 1-epimerase